MNFRPMLLQVLQRSESFTATAAGVWKNISMDVEVDGETAAPSKRHSTLSASMRLLASVESSVQLQTGRVGEELATLFAPVWPLTCMDLFVLAQVIFVNELFVAEAALEQFVESGRLIRSGIVGRLVISERL